MTIEEIIGAVIDAKLVRVLGRIDRLMAEVEAMRRTLPPALVTMPEAARLLGLSLRTVRRQVKAGKLPSCHVGRSVRVDLASLKPLTEDEVAGEARRLRTVPN